MKIKYEFATETVEIEVDEDVGNFIVDLNRKEYNINHKETRRHCSLEAFNLDDELLPSDENVEAEAITKADKTEVFIRQLQGKHFGSECAGRSRHEVQSQTFHKTYQVCSVQNQEDKRQGG